MTNRSIYILAILYAVTALVPTAHTLLHASERVCETCLAAPSDTDGPSFAPSCDGPCGDPTHHHHPPRHDQDHCSTCQWS